MATENGLAARQGAAEAPAAQAEPATGRALWPTFMRRTLAEDAVQVPAAGGNPASGMTAFSSG
jgi:hypothetical protein